MVGELHLVEGVAVAFSQNAALNLQEVTCRHHARRNMTEGWWIGGSVLPRTPWTMIYRTNKGGLNRWWWYYRATVCGNRRARNNSL
jgi:hypothetical protein